MNQVVEHRAMYFPYAVPSEAWIKQALLFNDSFSTIVFPDVPGSSTPYVPEANRATFDWLQSEGLWHPVVHDALTYADYDEIPESGWLAEGPLNERRKQLSELDWISMIRIASYIGFAYREGPSSTAARPYEFDKFMAEMEARRFSTLGSDHTLRVSPQTDSAEYYAVRGNQRDADAAEFRREIILDGLLPTPGPEISFADIVAFKNRHSDELGEFRVALDDLASDIAAGGSGDFLDRVQTARIRIELGIHQLQRAASSRRLGFLAGSAIVLSTAGVAGQLAPETTKWVFDGFGVAVAASVTARLVKASPSTESPFIYLFRTRTSFGGS